MSIKIATRIAIYGVAIGMVMSMLYPFVFKWVVENQRDSREMIMNSYLFIRALCEGGGLLVFLVTLNSKQKGD